jgi:uncharacterized protein YidB (DUF937 family)
MFDVLVRELSERYGLGERSRDLFGLLMGYIYNDHRGGFGGFGESFRLQGYGDLFASWLGGDARSQRSIAASEIGMVFGQGLLSDWGNRIGASRATVAAAIAGILPRLVGELTPGGRLPDAYAASGAAAGSRIEEDAGGDRAAAGKVAAPVTHFDDRITGTGTGTGLQYDGVGVGPDAPGDRAPPPPPGIGRYGSESPRRDGGRREPDTVAAAIDPHVAAITAAVTASTDELPSFAAGDPLRDVEFRRPPPQRKRGGSGKWVWVLILLALAAGGGYYWQRYHPLDGVSWPWSTAPAAS